jgi:uncharacterized protein (TIGR03067 family)
MRKVVTLMAALFIAGAGHADDKTAGVSKKLIGTWHLQKGVMAGSVMPRESLTMIRLELTEGKYRLAGAESPDVGTWKVVPNTKPMGIDITGTDGPNKGRTILGIVEVRGETMKVCYELSGKARPKKFESKPKTLLFLAEYKRVKKAT